jgi:hypothetical protein
MQTLIMPSSSLDDLRSSNEKLSGMDAMELRGFASKSPMIPHRDLTDPLGKALMADFQGQSGALRAYLDKRLSSLNGDTATLVKELYEKRWGPTKIPIFNVILQFLIFNPENKSQILKTTKYLANDLNVPADGTDMTGASSLYWAISTKPYTETEYAQVLFDAGASVNQKNRFNGTAASEIGQVDFTADTKKNVQMMKWYIEHGGDVDAKDNDGMNVRMLAEMMRKRVPAIEEVVKKGRGTRKDHQCENCGRKASSERPFSTCSRCKGVKYCSQECQKVDWKGHKKSCRAVA